MREIKSEPIWMPQQNQLNKRGHEIPDDTPVARRVPFTAPPTLQQQIAALMAREMAKLNLAEGISDGPENHDIDPQEDPLYSVAEYHATEEYQTLTKLIKGDITLDQARQSLGVEVGSPITQLPSGQPRDGGSSGIPPKPQVGDPPTPPAPPAPPAGA